MSKNKRTAADPDKAGNFPEEQADVLTQQLCDLALALCRHKNGSGDDASARQTVDLERCIKKCLNQKNDDALYESLECAKFSDERAYQFLREQIEQAAETVSFRRDDGSTSEVDVFVVPLLVRSSGGLQRDQCFEDQEAFDLLAASFKQMQLESPDATVVLISHAYHLDEIDGITYGHLHEMARDAFTAMTARKFIATTSIERSLRGWPDNAFGTEDIAVELRFLLGFSLKAAGDIFYRVPDDEATADAYFDARAQKFEQWAEQVEPFVKRCLATDDRVLDVHFLYQDLFHGGKERGIAEFFMLQAMSQLHHDLEQHAVNPANARGVIGPVDDDGETSLRITLYAQSGALISSVDKPVGFARGVTLEIADAADALTTLGVAQIEVASGFDADDQPLGLQPYADE